MSTAQGTAFPTDTSGATTGNSRERVALPSTGFLLAVGAVLTLYDAVLTFTWLAMGVPEANPFVVGLVKLAGLEAGVGLRAAFGLALLLILHGAAEHLRLALARRAMYVAVLALAAVATWHSYGALFALRLPLIP